MSWGAIRSANATADATMVAYPSRLRGLYFVGTAVAGNLEFRDGGASGTVLLEIDTPALLASSNVEIPRDGIKFGTNIYVNFDANVTSVSIFYD